MQAITALRAAFSGMSVQDDSSSGDVLECEVVEVKNTCPFRQQSGLTKKGKPRSSYLLRDPGPRQKVSQDAAMGRTSSHVQGAQAHHKELFGVKGQEHLRNPLAAQPECESRADPAPHMCSVLLG